LALFIFEMPVANSVTAVLFLSLPVYQVDAFDINSIYPDYLTVTMLNAMKPFNLKFLKKPVSYTSA